MVAYQPALGKTDKTGFPAAKALEQQWEHFSGLGSLGICNARPPRGATSGWSTHAECRAVDCACDVRDPTQLDMGDHYAAWLIANAETLRCQRIIWNRRSWTSGFGWKSYSGVSPHTDHLHVELNRGAPVSPLYKTNPFHVPDMKEVDELTPELKAELDSMRAGLDARLDEIRDIARAAQNAAQNAHVELAELAEEVERVKESVRLENPTHTTINTVRAIAEKLDV